MYVAATMAAGLWDRQYNKHDMLLPPIQVCLLKLFLFHQIKWVFNVTSYIIL